MARRTESRPQGAFAPPPNRSFPSPLASPSPHPLLRSSASSVFYSGGASCRQARIRAPRNLEPEEASHPRDDNGRKDRRCRRPAPPGVELLLSRSRECSSSWTELRSAGSAGSLRVLLQESRRRGIALWHLSGLERPVEGLLEEVAGGPRILARQFGERERGRERAGSSAIRSTHTPRPTRGISWILLITTRDSRDTSANEIPRCPITDTDAAGARLPTRPDSSERPATWSEVDPAPRARPRFPPAEPIRRISPQ